MPLQAGVAVRDVSPRMPMFLVGYPHVARISTGVHDPLLASALCLRNATGAVLLVAVDILFLSAATARALKRRIAGETGVLEEAIFISCTHTHSGPVTMDNLAWRDDPCVPPVDPAYLALITDGIADAAREAARTPHEVEIAWGTTNARGAGSNRLAPDGVTDPEVGLLAVRIKNSQRATRNSQLLALATVYGMHPTVLHEDSTLVSADFPGYTRQHLREALGEELVVVYYNAPCGNQSPRYTVTGQTFAEAERLGRMLGERILTGVQAITGFTSEAELASAQESIQPIPRAMPTVAEADAQLRKCVETYNHLRAEGAPHALVRTAECAIFGAEETVTLAHAQAAGDLARLHAEYPEALVQAVRVGDAALVGWPCEIFTDYALELKRAASGKVYPVCLVNGELQGYIVTPEAAAAGGYEAATSLFEPETGQLLVEKSLELLEKLVCSVEKG